jgi:hypothetical protein
MVMPHFSSRQIIAPASCAQRLVQVPCKPATRERPPHVVNQPAVSRWTRHLLGMASRMASLCSAVRALLSTKGGGTEAHDTAHARRGGVILGPPQPSASCLFFHRGGGSRFSLLHSRSSLAPQRWVTCSMRLPAVRCAEKMWQEKALILRGP